MTPRHELAIRAMLELAIKRGQASDADAVLIGLLLTMRQMLDDEPTDEERREIRRRIDAASAAEYGNAR